jgi:hypothetical protein
MMDANVHARLVHADIPYVYLRSCMLCFLIESPFTLIFSSINKCITSFCFNSNILKFDQIMKKVTTFMTPI